MRKSQPKPDPSQDPYGKCGRPMVLSLKSSLEMGKVEHLESTHRLSLKLSSMFNDINDALGHNSARAYGSLFALDIKPLSMEY